MPHSAPLSLAVSLALPLLAGLLGVGALGVGQAHAQAATAWKITSDRDLLADRVNRLAVTAPRSAPLQDGKSVTTALILSCGSPFPNGPTHPQLMILFTPLKHMFHVNAVLTRYRFDEGPIREYNLAIVGRNDAYAVHLPKFHDQDAVGDLIAAKRLRAEVYLPHTTNILLDFNVTGAGDAVKALACR